MRAHEDDAPRCCWVPLQGYAAVEELTLAEDRRTLFAWCRLPDGRGALWTLDPLKPPGEMQRAIVIDGA